jgi:hypothetical protein
MRAHGILSHPVLVSAANRLLALLTAAARLLAISPTNVYRPEAHYMRGPGPKWREKHAPSAVMPFSDRSEVVVATDGRD